MNKFYNLTNDHLFKLIFSEEEYLKELLLQFFNIDLKDKKIEYLNTELLKSNKINKVGTVDMLIGIKDKEELEEVILLELQNIDKHNFKERLEFYLSNIKARYSLKNGEDYKEMKKVTALAIVNYNLGYKDEVNEVNLTTIDNNEYKIFNEKVGYKIFNLSKIRNSNMELVKLFKSNNLEELEKYIKNIKCKNILEKMRIYNENEKEREKMDYIIELMKNETEHYGDAFIDGKEKGISIGEQKGIEKNKKDVAKNMLNKNFDLQTISECTGLTIKQIKKI